MDPALGNNTLQHGTEKHRSQDEEKRSSLGHGGLEVRGAGASPTCHAPSGHFACKRDTTVQHAARDWNAIRFEQV
jgi:hypothetical protein